MHMLNVRSARALLLVVILALMPTGTHAQSGGSWDTTGLQLTRAELEELLTRYEETASSSSYSEALREQARAEAALIRSRLEEGDLRVGDRVLLIVERHTELTDTFNVVAGRRLVLPQIGEVSVEGVLRSELQDHMAAAIARFIRDPVVRARSLIRLEINGAVGRPGFYTLPSDMLISDALMAAGGPAGNAELGEARIERSGEVIWTGESLREAVIAGRTLDQLSIRAGDSIIVPQESGRLGWIRDVSMVLGAVGSIVLIAVRVF
ncbi:MAG TPA: polysaccharide biosynthesis/export family protein [Longimicrobiales bacterium]|nr:polysaccharide biosynthesis/export family protein [Longimicrobiales bacterium]